MEDSIDQEFSIYNTLSNNTSTCSSNEQVYQLYNNQVGGHHSILCPRTCNDYIIKPAKKKELQFYEKMQQNREDGKLSQFLHFLPRFYGTTEITKSAKIIIQDALQSSTPKRGTENGNYELENSFDEIAKMKWLQSLFKEKHFFGRSLKLQNLTKDYKYPCVLDMKMGFTPPSEKHQDKFENSTSKSHGFRICGLNVYWSKVKKTIFKDKYWGRNIKEDDLTLSLALYFYNGEKVQKNVIEAFIKKLKKLKEALEIYKGFIFKSSSLLMVYDGESNLICDNQGSIYNGQQRLKNDSNTSTPSGDKKNTSDLKSTLKLIDFANVECVNSNRTDSELIEGITNLMQCLKSIITWENVNIELNSNFLKQQQHQNNKEQDPARDQIEKCNQQDL